MCNLDSNYHYQEGSGAQEFRCKLTEQMVPSGSTQITRFITYAGDAQWLSSAVTFMNVEEHFLTRILPSITNIDYSSGSPEGGHLLTIKGRNWG